MGKTRETISKRISKTMNLGMCACQSPIGNVSISFRGHQNGWEKRIAWSYDLAEHAHKYVERFCNLSVKNIKQMYKVSPPRVDNYSHHCCFPIIVPRHSHNAVS